MNSLTLPALGTGDTDEAKHMAEVEKMLCRHELPCTQAVKRELNIIFTISRQESVCVGDAIAFHR